MACSGEMLRYAVEHQLRRQLAKLVLTLRHESVGANRIRYPGSPRPKRCSLDVWLLKLRIHGKPLSEPPGEYDRKVETQRN